MRMPLEEAVRRAGSLEALLPHLREGRAPARHNGLYRWPTGEAVFGPGDIDPHLWAKALVEPDIGQAVFTMEFPLSFIYDKAGNRVRLIRKVLARDIEVERRRYVVSCRDCVHPEARWRTGSRP